MKLAGAVGFGVLLAVAAGANAAERTQVCAREGSSARAYKVQATYMTGQELVEATHSFQYETFARYVVIFWNQSEASVIKLDFPVLNPIGVDGTDQQGRRWNVSTNSFCL